MTKKNKKLSKEELFKKGTDSIDENFVFNTNHLFSKVCEFCGTKITFWRWLFHNQMCECCGKWEEEY
jgi:hypothetical protein